MLLRLHSIGHKVINGATMGDAILPELAQELIMGLEEAITRLQAWAKRIEGLEALAARD